MNSFYDEFNPLQARINPFNPHRYDMITSWIERLTPDVVTKLGCDSVDDLMIVINQEYSLYETFTYTDQIP
jgi:hypothetical protein